MPKHRYKVGDIVGICSDCMADCEILECLPKKPREALSYRATAIRIHHPNPEKSFFGENKEFQVKEKQIVVKLGEK